VEDDVPGTGVRGPAADEAFIDVPLKLMAIGAAMGSVGALPGKAVANSLPMHEERSA